jgi:probable HAF family extracellular repeat protein
MKNLTKADKLMTKQFIPLKIKQLRFLVLFAACSAMALPALALEQTSGKQSTHYRVSNLESLGGTSSGGNSINDRDWIAGYSKLTGDQARHAALWRRRTGHSILDLGTLGGPNSSITWNVKNTSGVLVGISQTAEAEPLGEAWSSAAFYSGPNAVGFINLAFVLQDRQMRALPNFPGGDNGFATGANNLHQVVGWAENDVHDPTCVSPQVLQFRPALWTLGPPDQIQDLPLIAGDSSGAATAINDNAQIVGISGICDQAVGRYTAAHAVLWENGGVTDLGNLGALFWNTPTAINQQGDIVGFAGAPDDPDGNFLQAFIWTVEDGMQPLGFLPGDVHSEAYGINESRQVVGLSCDADGNCRGFVWENGVMQDLNDLKQPNFSATIETAKDINNKGEITGRALDPNTGVRTAYVAVPAGQ